MRSTVIKKFTAVITAAAFIVSVFFTGAYSAVMPATTLPAEKISALDRFFETADIIPLSLGKVTGISDAQSDTVIVNIQDLHSHAEIQKNIAAIIKIIDEQTNLTGIYTEGGVGNIDVNWINNIENEELKISVIERLLNDGDLSAAEYYAMTSGENTVLRGLENKKIHGENIARLAKIESNKERYYQILNKADKEIGVLNKIYTGSRNIRFNNILSKHNQGKINDSKFYAVLSKYVKKINSAPQKYNNTTKIDFNNYPNIGHYLSLTNLSSKINSQRASAELGSLMGFIKNHIPYKQYRNLQSSTSDFKDTEKLVEFINIFAEEMNINLEAKYNNLNVLIKINDLSRRINPLALIKETRLLSERIKTALAYDSTEAEITFLTDFKDHFKNYLTASLTSGDWLYVKANLNRFLDIYAKYAAVDDINAVKSDFAEINLYYDINDQRNNIFISNIISRKPSVSEISSEAAAANILKTAKEVKVVVTGGYHSEGLKELLAKQKISSVLITPNITIGTNEANVKYKEMIKRQSKFSQEALAYLIASSAGAIEQQALILSAVLRLSDISDELLFATIENIKKQGFNVDKNGGGYTITPTVKNSSLNSIKLQIKDGGITLITDSGEAMDSVSAGMTEEQKNTVIAAAGNILSKILPSEDLLTGFAGLEYDALKTFFYSLYQAGFYFSRGVISEIEDAGYLKPGDNGAEKILDSMPVSIVGRFPVFMQKMIFSREKKPEENRSIADILTDFNSLDGGKNSNFKAGTTAAGEEPLTVSDFISMIDSAAENGFNGVEASMFLHRKTYENDATYNNYPAPAIFWQQKKAENGKPMFTINKTLEEYERVMRELKDGEAEKIKKRAADKNIRISAHLNSIDLYNDNGIVVRPVPFIGSRMYDLYRLQIDMAEIFGADTAVLHLTSLKNAKGYAELIKYAAEKNIRINFENEFIYDEREYSEAFDAYNDASLAGYGSSGDFVKALEGIRNELIGSEGRNRYENYYKNYFGVVLDTSKALNSYTVPVEIKGEEISAEEKKAVEEQISEINLENLMSYYNAITSAGFNITQLHLAQFAKSYDLLVSKTLKAVKAGESGKKKYVAFYNKQIIDSQDKEPAFDMIAFLNFLKEQNFHGILEQETGSKFVAPSNARLTMPWLAKFVNLLPVRGKTKEAVVAAVETPLMALAFAFPSFEDFFLNKMHGGESEARKTGFEAIKTAVNAAWEASYSKIPLINLCKKIANAAVVQYRLHIEHNLANPDDKLKIFSSADSQAPFLKEYNNSYEIMLNSIISRWEATLIIRDNNLNELYNILKSGFSAEEKMNALYPKAENLFNRLNDGSLFGDIKDSSYAKTRTLSLLGDISPLSIKITEGVADFTLFNKFLELYEKNTDGAQYLPDSALLIKTIYLYGIETGNYKILSRLKQNLIRDYQRGIITDIYEAYKWVNENFPEFFMKTSGSVNDLKNFYEGFLGIDLGVDWNLYQNSHYVPGYTAIADKLAENNISFSDELLLVENKKRSAAADSSGENYFDLFERFVEYNKIALAELGGEQGSVAMANSIAALRNMMDIVAKFDGQDIYDSAQKQLEEIKEVKDVNAVINYVHQSGIKRMKMRSENTSKMLAYKKSSLKTETFQNNEPSFNRELVQLEIYNFSDKPLNPDVLEFFSGLLLNSNGSGAFFVKDNKIIWDFGIGQHSFYTVIDLQDLNEGLTYVYNEGLRNSENAIRVSLFAIEAVQNGMDITHLDVQTNERSDNPTIPGVCGLNAVYRASGKITAPREYANIVNVIYRMMIATAGLDSRISGNISDEIMIIYSARRNQKVYKLTDDDFAKLKGTVGNPFIRGLTGINIDLRIGEMLEQRYKMRFEALRNHRVLSDTVYNLLGIYDPQDRNMAEIERRFIEKRITLKYGVLANNENYQPAYDITAELNEGLSERSRLKKSFELAGMVNAAGVENFAFREEAAIGKMSAVSGVLRLKDGYLSVKGLLNPETDSIECAYAEFVSHDNTRKTVGVKSLNKILNDNGYLRVAIDKEETTDSRINYVLKQINTAPMPNRIPLIRGITVSKGSAAGRLTSDKSNPSDDNILMFAQPAPADIGLISKFKGLIVKLNKLAHSAVLIREEKTPALSVPSSLRDGKTVVSVMRYVDEPKTVNGFKVTELSASKRVLQDGEYVIINGNKAQLFDLLPPWFIDEISRVIRDKDERRLLEIVNWDNREETRLNIFQILTFIYSRTANAEGLIIRQTLKDKIDKSSVAGQIIKELDLNALAIGETLQIADEMAENAAAIRETDAKKAFTVILHAEDMINELQENTAPTVIQKKAELARLKSETFKYFEKEVKDFIDKAGKTLAAANPKADDIYKLIDIASYWDNFYNYPGIKDLVKNLEAKFNELKSRRTDSGRIKTLSELGALDIEDNGSKAVNVARLKRMAELYPRETEGFQFADGFVLGHSAITAMLEGKTANGLTYSQLIDILKAARNKKEADDALSMLRELVQNFKIDDSASKFLKQGIRYAVRSSGVGEDGNEKSYAGVAETELEIDGNIEAVNAAIIKVLLSFFKPSSIEYTEGGGYLVLPSVLVQEMVTGVRAAGQIFTADNSGNELMDMVFGLGEGSVSGRVAADNITYKPGADVALYKPADERIMKIAPAENGGTQAVPLADNEKSGNVLTEAEVKAWIGFSKAAAEEFGYELDIECAADIAGIKWPLQARPITTFVKKGYDVSEFVSSDISDSTGTVDISVAETAESEPSAEIFKRLINAVRIIADKLLLITERFGNNDIHTLAVRFEYASKADVGAKEGNDYTIYVVNDASVGESSGIMMKNDNGEPVSVRISRENNKVIVSANGVKNYEDIVRAVSSSKALKSAISAASGIKAGNLRITSIIENNENGVSFDEGIMKTENAYFNEADGVSALEEYMASLSDIERSVIKTLNDKGVLNLSGEENYKAFLEKILEQTGKKGLLEGKIIITAAQYEEFKKDILNARGSTLFDLSVKGIKFYAIDADKDGNYYSEEGFRGIISQDKAYDYITREETGIRIVKDAQISKKDLANMFLTYNGMIAVSMNILREIDGSIDSFGGAFILQADSLLGKLIGNLFEILKFNLGEITANDALNIARNISLDNIIPYVKQDVVYNVSSPENIIAGLNLPGNNQISIFLNNSDIKAEAKAAYIQGVIERVLTAQEMLRIGNNGEISDKGMEILLGKMLFLKNKENIPDIKFESGKRYNEQERFEEVMNFANLAFSENSENRNYAVNAVIDLIGTLYFEPMLMIKNKKKEAQNLSNIVAYKSILSAA